ncbi:MAG: hypothetical protein BWY88_01124 [Synergistetes bacterium ADurb.Bin520]|nr:MAG: hypothetical protein BWY88_01124 [Synergistetes bacterium ADurb.Bin520]
MGTLVPWASETRAMIWERKEAPPTRVTRTLRNPSTFTVAPVTSSPGDFTTGSGSPEIMASSTLATPSTISPSWGIFSPGRTTSRSPGTRSSTGISTSPSGRSTRAVRAPISTSLAISRVARLRAPVSR